MANTRVQWNDEEWNKVCTELHKRLPNETKSSTLTGIKSEDVFAAMRKALPENRWRVSMNMTQTRPHLLHHFKMLRKRLDQLDADTAAQAAREAEENDTKVKNALEPLAKLLAKQLFDHLRPMIDDYVASAVFSTANRNKQVDAVQMTHRERRAKIGVIGLLPIQQEAIKANFPLFDFEFVEKGSNSDDIRGKMANATAVFGLTQKMAHNAEYVLKKMPVWEHYHRVGGKGTSAVKRSIEIWANQQAQKQ